GMASANMDAQFSGINVNINGLQEATVVKNQAKPSFPFCMRLTAPDGRQPAIGKTIIGFRSIDGGAFVSVSGTFDEIGSGTYVFNALAADTNGDELTWRFTAADCDDTLIYITTSDD